MRVRIVLAMLVIAAAAPALRAQDRPEAPDLDCAPPIRPTPAHPFVPDQFPRDNDTAAPARDETADRDPRTDRHHPRDTPTSRMANFGCPGVAG